MRRVEGRCNSSSRRSCRRGRSSLASFWAGWRLRPAYEKQLEAEGRKREWGWVRKHRVPVGDDPIAWKERYIEGLAPMRALRHVPLWTGELATAILASALAIFCWLHPGYF